MNRQIADIFSRLLKGQYGLQPSRALERARQRRSVFRNVHGEALVARRRRKRVALVQSIRFDDGQAVLVSDMQFVVDRGEGTDDVLEEQYVVRAADRCESHEYVLNHGGLSLAASVSLPYHPDDSDVVPTNKARALEENRWDLLEGTHAVQQQAPGKAALVAPATGTDNELDGPPPPSAAAAPASAAESDFVEDLRAILSGQKVYDPRTQQMIRRDQLGPGTKTAPQMPSRPEVPPAPEAANEQAIFDRIAQSMQYANAYDLGTVEIANRFAEFDRLAELQQKADARKAETVRQPERAAGDASLDTADFIQDLGAIRSRSPGSASSRNDPTAASPPVTQTDHSAVPSQHVSPADSGGSPSAAPPGPPAPQGDVSRGDTTER